jgi:hypothetical protein
MRYLLAAEADKIQDFIFRSSRLREVVGASQLLTRFCEEGAPELLKQPVFGGDPKQDIVVNDGGSFRIIFDDLEKARQFGADLAELYRLTVDGTISVAQPVELGSDFREANKAAGRNLRRTKSHRDGAVADGHMPYVAFCASCGVGLADQHAPPKKGRSNRSIYLCATCRIKAQERDREPRAILDRFYAAYSKLSGEDPLARPDWAEDADAVAEFDLRKRNYVAYLVADGNGMGDLFGQCDEQQIKAFSDGLTSALNASLADPTEQFRKTMPGQAAMVPVLPLILGGDDLFALIPAPYALDFARRFCLAYEDQLQKLVDDVKLDAHPTVAAAVVICKSKYPYALAHHRAEELLKEAKRQCKLLAAGTGQHLSAVNFEVVLGNRLAGQEDGDSERCKAVRTTLRPYWVVKDGATLSPQAELYGFDLQRVLKQRLALKNVPNKRLVELRKRFESLPSDITVDNAPEKLRLWTQSLEPLLKSCGRKTEPVLRAALAGLGQPFERERDAHYWRELQRDGGKPAAHGILDILEAWDFSQDLTKGPEAYEPEEENKR